MIYLKSVAAGIITAVAVCLLWVLGELGLLIAASVVQTGAGAGSAGIGAVSVGVTETVFYVAPVAFALGFYWQWRRHANRRAR